MKIHHKKGFTLVEILIVVVIMGVLAAVAVPKLFGTVAKAKAAELPVAASTYIKLLEAASYEHGIAGNWKTIGYSAPGNGETNTFRYCEGEITQPDTKNETTGEGMIGWEATNKYNLNECKKGNWWTVTIAVGEGGAPVFSKLVSAAKCVAIAHYFTAGATAGIGCGKASNNVAEQPLTPTDVGYTMSVDSIRQGGWAYSGNSYNDGDGVVKNQYSTYNKDSEDGLYELQPNSTYEYTVVVPEDLWDESKGKFFQTVTRVYTDEYDKGVATILCGSTLSKDESDPNKTGYTSDFGGANGYNTGSKDGKAAGYTAEATMEHVTREDGTKVVVTKVTLTTGNATGHFGANFLSSGGWTQTQRDAAQTAIKTSTLKLAEKSESK